MPGTERTLVLVKPDGVQRQLVGRILARYKSRGLKLVGLKLVRVDRDHAERHYAAHRGQAVLRRPRRLHHLRPAGRAGLRWPERDRRRPRHQRGDPSARGGTRDDPGRPRPGDRPEHRPRVGQPGVGGLRARPVVRAERTPRLRPRHRPLGARPERVGAAREPARRRRGVGSLRRLGSEAAREYPRADRERSPRPGRSGRVAGRRRRPDRRTRRRTSPTRATRATRRRSPW